MKMSKLRVGLLSLIALVQVSTIVGGFFAYLEMSDRYWKLQFAYDELLRKYDPSGPWISYAMQGNPFVPIGFLVLFSLFLTIVLLVDEVRGRKRTNAKGGENVNV